MGWSTGGSCEGKGHKINVLIYTEAWGGGGIEAFVMNVVRRLQNKGLRFDIFSTWEWPGISDEELKSLGIHRASVFKGRRPNQVIRLIRGVSAFSGQLKKGRYDAVWINTMNGLGFLYARKAKRLGIPVRVVHSHNSDVGEGMKTLKRIVGKTGGMLWSRCSSSNIACSRAAGEYLFGRRPFSIVNNGIDTEHFRFSPEKRKTARLKLGISSDEILIGSIGRIANQKNPLFQLEVFVKYKEINEKSRYLMVGKGDMVPEVLTHMSEIGLERDDVIIINPVDDPSSLYCALDAFLMPSLFEGLPLTLIEAQCSGLPVLASDTFSAEADIPDLVQRVSLKATPSRWAVKLDDLIVQSRAMSRESFAYIISMAGYSEEESARKMSDIFLNQLNEN